MVASKLDPTRAGSIRGSGRCIRNIDLELRNTVWIPDAGRKARQASPTRACCRGPDPVRAGSARETPSVFQLDPYLWGLATVLSLATVGWVARLARADAGVADSPWSVFFLASGVAPARRRG